MLIKPNTVSLEYGKVLRIQLRQHRHPSLDPVLLRVIRFHRNPYKEDEVGRMPRRRQHPPPLARLVHGALVEMPLPLFFQILGRAHEEPYDRHVGVQFPRAALYYVSLGGVPGRTFHEQSADIRPVFGRRERGLLLGGEHLEVEGQQIDRHRVPWRENRERKER